MGCFSYLCKVSGKGVESTSFDGEAVHLFLLRDGKVIEHMYGNYDSYGRVFSDSANSDSFEWKMDWHDVCGLNFGNDQGSGIAAILAIHYNGEIPTTRSDGDPDQGWGEDGESFADTSANKFERVKEPFHKVYH